jgi:alkylated DNA repair dioxygenase AlkB
MRQQSLFATREIPEGLVFKPNFLTLQEERDLLALLQTLPFYEFKLHGVAAKRRVLHFGLRYDLESRVLSTAPEIPSQFEPIRRRAAEFAGIGPDDFSQILVNEYRPGAGIGWHHDSPTFEIVAGISLGATCTMRFQHGSGEQRRTSSLELPSRSIYLLKGNARNLWQHRIGPIHELRYSITMRTLRKHLAMTIDLPLKLRSAKLRMTEFGCCESRNGYEHQQHNHLGNHEGRLGGLRGGQRFQCRDAAEKLYHQYEHIEIQSNHGGDDVGCTPATLQVTTV